ncbi:MAG: metal-sensitive transcriptional regulator [Actinobacteria bacterium]|nr:metal-sensitive transcriptional regulator [Actinomycetota bacterium]
MLPEYKKDAELRLKVAAGHLEGVRRMLDQDAYCVDLMKQLSAVQGTLQRVQQIFLRNHLSTCVSDAIKNGMGDAIIDELMTALKYDSSLVDGRGPVDTGDSSDAPFAAEPAGGRRSEL